MESEIAYSLPEPHKIAFTIKEAAHASSLSRSLLYVAIGKGVLEAQKLGGRTLILEKDLQKFLASLPRLSEIEATPQPQRRRGRPPMRKTA